ncbi:nuclease-related domain-containing protein [Piscibacillus halophilus]|uniref:Nuclease-related domain-containing protein n=1 Tax=Piscibacillus halophilus TaxID=571933 RepID=A0A1H9IQ68_9BACI|nr:nuclease-related domain-containing protein [Piscibacillus halophilus]SEQ76753.1 Nuclease-related domain-containing protein [Piscibacillus halophilus]
MHKEHDIPPRLLRLIAIQRNLVNQHPILTKIEDEIASYSSGYQGELSIDYHINYILDPHNKLHNLRIPLKNWHFEIDTLLVFEKFMLALEIKNLRGDIYIDHEAGIMKQLHNEEEKVYQSPLVQVEKQVRQLNYWLSQRNYHVPIEPLVVFVNPNVHLKANHSRIIYPFILSHKYYEIKAQYQKYDSIKQRSILIDSLIKHTELDNQQILKHFNLTKSDFKPGVICPQCHLKTVIREKYQWLCTACQYKDKHSFISALKEYFLLFGPVISAKEAREWLQINISTARYLLKSLKFNQIGKKKYTKYIMDFDLRKDFEYLIEYNKAQYKQKISMS